MDELFRQEWPGNVRELRNTVFRAMVMARGDTVQLRDLQAVLAGSGAPPAAVASVSAAVPASNAAPAASSGPAASGPATAPGSGLSASVEVPPLDATPPETAPAAAVPLAAAPPVVAPAIESDNAVAASAPTAVDIPRPDPSVPAPAATAAEARVVDPSSLPPRLLDLYQTIVARGQYSTHDHMEHRSLSHRTALRDLQALVASGLVERIGTRRGAFYRPCDRSGRIADPAPPAS
jgi:hypothetical protein